MATVKVTDLPINNAPTLTDFSIVDNAAGDATKKSTLQNMRNTMNGWRKVATVNYTAFQPEAGATKTITIGTVLEGYIVTETAMREVITYSDGNNSLIDLTIRIEAEDYSGISNFGDTNIDGLTKWEPYLGNTLKDISVVRDIDLRCDIAPFFINDLSMGDIDIWVREELLPGL